MLVNLISKAFRKIIYIYILFIILFVIYNFYIVFIYSFINTPNILYKYITIILNCGILYDSKS